jgi:hypothetical protein
VEAIHQNGGRRRQKDILAEEINGNCRREEYNYEKITSQLRLREDQKRYVTQIKIVRENYDQGGVSIDENGVIRESTGWEHLEEFCNKSNEAKLQQTADTPVVTGALQEDVGWLGIGPEICIMLDGTYDPPPEEVDE